MWISSSAGQVHSGHTYRTAWFARDRLGRSMDCKTPFDALAVKSSIAQKGAGAKSSLLLFLEVEVSFYFNLISLPAKSRGHSCRTPITYSPPYAPVFSTLPLSAWPP